jgi:hypothetical protein
MPIEAWFLAAFFGSCVGLGFAAGYTARRRRWGSWTIGMASVGVALFWPIIVLATFSLTNRGACEPPCDAPVYVLMGILMVVPLLFVFGFVLAVVGGLVAWWRFRSDAPPNKSLDRSHGKRVSHQA